LLKININDRDEFFSSCQKDFYMNHLQCATLDGIEAKAVQVEFTATKGLPAFTIVGMANTAISESKERVKSSLLSNQYTFPPKRLTISLSPSDLKKEGSHFDLAIALLIALGNEQIDLSGWFVFGELGLDGSVKDTALLYPIILSLAKQNALDKVLVPHESLEKLIHIPNIKLHSVHTLKDALEIIKNEHLYPPLESLSYPHPFHLIHGNKYFYMEEYPNDFIEIRGQEQAKRSALIAAAGMHNLLLEGSPGSGKSMIAKRLVHILPPLDTNEILECAKLSVLEGKEPHFNPIRPFRSPHHSSTNASIFGGGSQKAQIGEVGLAHKGILFFDELPHFSKKVLEAMREPLEDRQIRVSRVHSKATYEADMLFVGAMNPCPCGNLLNQNISCRCSELEVARYRARLSDPFLDRIDLYVQMSPMRADDKPSLSSKELHSKVFKAFSMQKSRGQIRFNGSLNDTEIKTYCNLSDEAQHIFDQAIGKFHLSFRAINRLLKVARTIADLEQADQISKAHVLEALSFRRR